MSAVKAAGNELKAAVSQRSAQAGSPVKASMLRDLEAGQKVEAAHVVGDMLHRARRAGQEAPLLAAAWCHLQAYEASLPR